MVFASLRSLTVRNLEGIRTVCRGDLSAMVSVQSTDRLSKRSCKLVTAGIQRVGMMDLAAAPAVVILRGQPILPQATICKRDLWLKYPPLPRVATLCRD